MEEETAPTSQVRTGRPPPAWDPQRVCSWLSQMRFHLGSSPWITHGDLSQNGYGLLSLSLLLSFFWTRNEGPRTGSRQETPWLTVMALYHDRSEQPCCARERWSSLGVLTSTRISSMGTGRGTALCVALHFAISGSRSSPTDFAAVVTTALVVPHVLDQDGPSSTRLIHRRLCEFGFCPDPVLCQEVELPWPRTLHSQESELPSMSCVFKCIDDTARRLTSTMSQQSVQLCAHHTVCP